MATPLNVEVLERMGFAIPDDATVNHLVVAVRLDDDGALDGVLLEVDQALSASRRQVAGPSEDAPPRTTASALRREPGGAGPGLGAGRERRPRGDGRARGRQRRDGVQRQRPASTRRSRSSSTPPTRDLLVMGPDCGTAVIGGLGLGFANVVSPGPVGIVAASGTGCQQVLALLDHAGVGVTTAYGVGGRDLSAEVGGLATRTALARLDDDPGVEVAMLISKPPADDVARELAAYTETMRTPRPPRAARRRQARPDRGHRGAAPRARPRRTRVAGPRADAQRHREQAPRTLRRRHHEAGGRGAGHRRRGRCRADRLRRRRVHDRPCPPDDRPDAPSRAPGRGRGGRRDRRRTDGCRARPRRRGRSGRLAWRRPSTASVHRW